MGYKVTMKVLALSIVVVWSSLASGCATVVELALGAERGRANVSMGSDVLADGSRMVFWQRRHRAPRPLHDTVVMLHGLAANKDHWTRFAQNIPDTLDVIAVDLPGSGDSSKDLAQRYDADTQAKRLHAFFLQQGIKRCHLFGNSMGGLIAAHYAMLYPDDVLSLVLFAPAGIDAPVAIKQPLPSTINTVADFDAMLSGAFVRPPVIPGVLKTYFMEQMREGAAMSQKVRADLEAYPQPLQDRVQTLKPRTLVVWGDSDRIIDPSAAPQWSRRLTSGDVVIMRDTGHAPMLERPQESAALVMVWLNRYHLVQHHS